ncbi:hypothetical protein C942_00927 [Photobacterium marinum]|uniref:Uncharacterized protein n=1 Tax=Photobacterium marinum TaxID=1056511 RepID=L8JAF1_9GAMM|nr:hypothetical protein [Photobacterium marinum]ELR65840.1 hypothetical protein C942_00927 [Photobacterium marinum]
MAWETGTAEGHADLLAKLKLFAEKHGWTVKRWKPRTVEKKSDELILESVDAVSRETFIAAFKATDDDVADRYNWTLYCAPLYYDTLTFEQIPDKNPYHYMYLWDEAITYYFITDAEHRHLKVIAQVSTTTHVIYMGRINMYASIKHWPDQYCCFGEGTDANLKWNSTGNGISTYQYARNDARHIHWLGNVWVNSELTWPMQPKWLFGLYDGYQTSFAGLDHWMIPIHPGSNTHRNLGEFIGSYLMSGPNASTGQLLKTRDHLRTFLVVQNVYRTSDNDFMCLELL